MATSPDLRKSLRIWAWAIAGTLKRGSAVTHRSPTGGRAWMKIKLQEATPGKSSDFAAQEQESYTIDRERRRPRPERTHINYVFCVSDSDTGTVDASAPPVEGQTARLATAGAVATE